MIGYGGILESSGRNRASGSSGATRLLVDRSHVRRCGGSLVGLASHRRHVRCSWWVRSVVHPASVLTGGSFSFFFSLSLVSYVEEHFVAMTTTTTAAALELAGEKREKFTKRRRQCRRKRYQPLALATTPQLHSSPTTRSRLARVLSFVSPSRPPSPASPDDSFFASPSFFFAATHPHSVGTSSARLLARVAAACTMSLDVLHTHAPVHL